LKITKRQAVLAAIIGETFEGRMRAPDFKCIDFVRIVYRAVGITIPRLGPWCPPSDFNIGEEELADPPVGHLMFLKDRTDPRTESAWTHTVIIVPGRKCVHCSLFLGEKVVITPLEELWQRYDFAPSVEEDAAITAIPAESA